jgi:ABC-type amino acid transport substrate-binding protein
VFRKLFVSLALVSAPAFAANNDWVIESTAAGGTPETAKPYLDQLAAYAKGKLAGFAPLNLMFFNDAKLANLAIDDKKPGFAMLDLDIFLERRVKDDLVVIANVEGAIHNRGHLHILVKDPAIKTVDDLKGKTIVSNQISSPKFLSKVMFGGKYDAEKFFVLQPTPSPLKGMKAVDRGEAAATIVDDQQLANMKSMPFASSLRTLYSSPALPATPFVAFGKVAKPDDRTAVQKMLYGMCSDANGAPVCKNLQVTKFDAPNQKLYDDVIKRYDAK